MVSQMGLSLVNFYEFIWRKSFSYQLRSEGCYKLVDLQNSVYQDVLPFIKYVTFCLYFTKQFILKLYLKEPYGNKIFLWEMMENAGKGSLYTMK